MGCNAGSAGLDGRQRGNDGRGGSWENQVSEYNSRKRTSVHTATKGSLDGRGLLEVGSGTIGRETRLNGLLVLSVGADTRSVGAERGERDKPLGVMSGRQKRELTRYTGKSFQRR